MTSWLHRRAKGRVEGRCDHDLPLSGRKPGPHEPLKWVPAAASKRAWHSDRDGAYSGRGLVWLIAA